MSKFFNKKKSENEELEDFVLFNSDDESDIDNADNFELSNTDDVAENNIPADNIDAVDEDIQHTITINTDEVEDNLEPAPISKKNSNKNKKHIEFIKSHRVLSICVASLLIAAIISGAAFGFVVLSNPLYGYAQSAAEKTGIMKTFDVSGVLESGDKYEITSLVPGRITESDFEVGDTVKEGDLLYQIDDTDAKLAVEKAKNEVDRAGDTTADESSAEPTTLKILASEAGTVSSISIKTGSMVSPGSQVGSIKKTDGSTSAIISYVSGSVAAVSVKAGQNLSPGQVIATINPTSTTTKRNTVYDEKSAKIDLQVAEQNLENHSIKSPVDGIIVEKSTKVGDNVAITNSEKPMMIVLDTSHLKFTFSVDEHQIGQFEKGQTVSVNAESVPDTDFSGEVVAVSTEGVASEDGKPMYKVTVSIDEPGKLKSGMNVTGKVVIDSKKNVLSVPEDALMESDGKNALVLVKSDSSDSGDKDVSETLENELNYPWIDIPKGCELVSVKYGLSDGTNVQIISGIELGDIVVYDPKAEHTLVPSTQTDSKGSDDDKSTSNKNSKNNDTEATSDEELERAIEEQLKKMEQNL